MGILLGGIPLTGFNVVSGVRFGGAQAMAVHQLPGGRRIIDALGPDDANICWSGYLSGSDANARARLLDSMRVAGNQLALSWDEAVYTVVIASIDFCYHKNWWISYNINCTVVTDPPQVYQPQSPSGIGLVVGDLGIAGSYINIGASIATVAAPDATTSGTPANIAASGVLFSLSAQTASAIATADAGMGASDINSLVSTAGTLAAQTMARGYLARAGVNFGVVTT